MTVEELIFELEKYPGYYTVKIQTPGMKNLDDRDACLVEEDEYDVDAVCIQS